MAAIYRVGDRVDGLYDENTDDMWYPGRIRCVHAGEAEPDSADGPTFEVLYDDGEVETHVRPEFLRQHVPGTICVGTRVLCRYDGGEEYYPGQVSDVQENGRYTIAYDDGEVEEDVPLAHILEPKEEEKDEAEAADAADEEEHEKASDDAELEQQQEEDENDEKDAEMEEAEESPNNPAEDTFSGADVAQENEESVNGDDKSDEPVTLDQFDHPRHEQPKHNEAFSPSRQNEELPDPSPAGVSAERAYIVESLQLLEKRLGDSASTKSVLSTLVKQMRAYPQVTADLVHEHGGERLIIDALKFHQSHAVIQCYGFVLLRRLCFLCVKSTHYLLRNGIVELVIQAMNAFAEDAILQASACGALAVFTRVQSGLNILIEYQVAQLVLSTLIYHKTYSVHTRQVHYYACEVLLELCELDDLQTLNLLCGEQEEDFTGDMAPISLLLFLLRQGLSLDDKKACCAVGSLLMCLAASGKRAAALILGLNGIAELSTVMARYPTEPSIQKYSAAASKQIALCTVRQSPTKRIKDTATEILREAESLENTPTDRQPVKKSSLRGRSTSIGKRKSNPATGYGAPSYPRGAAYTSSTPYRHTQGFSKASSPYGQGASGFGGDMSTFGYPARDFPGAATAPQQPSSLVILDGSLGMDSGFGSTNKRKQLSNEDRQSELFDAYGIQGVPSAANGRPYGTKRAQLRAHLASAESAWAPPQQHAPSSSKPYSSRSDYVDHGSAYSHRDFMSSRQNRWDDNDEPHHATVYEPEVRQPRGAKRKKKNPAPRTAFQVKIENENQLRVSRETRSPYPSPQRLGVATKRAAKARQKRITGGGYSSLTGRSNNTSSESLNDYATQLFQDNVSRAGSGMPASSKLTPREKEEIRERERLSFAEKLHKMIDKAKSTLANGSTTPVPAVDHTSRQKSSASSKTARKTREPSSDDKRPISKKSRPAVSSTPKYTPKEILSPRESTEIRPAKPTSGASKRQAAASEGHQTPSGHQAPMVARAKQVASRPVVPPKVTSEQKPRTVVKSNKSAATKSADKKEVEGVKESVATAVVAEVVPPSTPAINEPVQVDPDAVTVEALPETVDEVPAPTDTTPTQQVEPEVSSSIKAAAVDVESVPSEVPTELVEPAVQEDNSSSNAPEPEITAEEADPLAATETETVTSPVDAPLTPHEEAVSDTATEVNVKAATEEPEASEEAPETSVSPLEEPSAMPDPAEDQPSGGSATDAMYGDAYNEFDDNGGDDEDMTAEAGADAEDTQMQDTGASDPPNDVPLQESKSGEALYDDGYDEFDEDDTPNAEEAEADDAPAADAEANPKPETTDETSGVSIVGESEPAASVVEAESEQVSAESDNPSDAPAENGSNADEEAEVESAVQEGGDVDDSAGGGETECAVAEPEESNDPQPDPADVAVISEEAPRDPDVLVSNTEEEQNESTSPNLEGESVPEPTGDNNLEGSGGNEPVVTEDAGGNDTSDHLVDAAGANLEGESSPEADITTSVAEPAVVENEAGDTEAGIQSAAAEEEEAPATDLAGEAANFVDPESEEAQADPSPLQQDEGNSTEVTEAATEGLKANESAPLTEQDDEQAKTLLADASMVSIQSAAYDEDNFDDEESHIEADPSEKVADVNPVAPPAEEAAELEDQAAGLVDPQQEQDGETSQVADAQVDANDATPDANNEEEDAKGLTANCSELSVQSAAYEDDDFDDGAHEEVAQESNTESEVQTPDREPTVDEDAEVDEPVALPETDVRADEVPLTSGVESEALSEPVASGAEDLDITAPSESSKGNADEALYTETTDEALNTETTDESPELQQVVPSDSAAMSESGTVADVPANEGTVLQDEAAEDHRDDPQTENSAENANGDDTKSDATPEAHLERTDILPSSDESTTAPSEPTDTDASQLPEITVPTDELAQEEAAEQPGVSAQPATYDEDDFDNGGEEEQVPPSLTTQDSDLIVVDQMDEGLKNDEADVQPSSEQTTDEAEGASAAENNFDEPTVVSSEPELQAEEQQEQPAIESESIPTTEDEIAANDVERAVSSGEEVSDPGAAADDNTQDSPVDEVGVIAVEVPSPEPETTPSTEPELQSTTPNEQVIGEEGSTSAEDNAGEVVVPESAVDLAPADEALESEPQSTILDEQNEAEGIVETPADEYEPDAAGDAVTEQVPDSTQAGDELAGDSPESDPIPADDTAIADNAAEPLEEATQEENQYRDTGFDEVENDAAALKETASESALVQDGPGETGENAAAEVPETENALPIDIAEPEERNAEVAYDDSEFQTEEAEADPAATFASDETQMNQDPAEPAEAPAEITGDHDEGASDQCADDAAPEAASGSPSDEIINAPDADTQGEPHDSSPGAATYEEDFPSDTLPETDEEVPMGNSEEAATSDDNAVADSDSPAIESTASDVPAEGAEPSADVDVVAGASTSNEGYDEGFDEDTATPGVDPSDPVDSTPVAEDTAASADVEISTTLETPQDAVVAESDQLIEGEIDPNAETVAEDGQEVKSEDCDTANSVEVEPTEASVESEVVDPEVAELEAKPETAEMEITDSEVAAESNGVETVLGEPEVTEPTVEADMVNDEFTKSEEPDPAESSPSQPETAEPEADAAKEPEAVESKADAPEAPEAESVEAGAPQEPEAMATEDPEAVESEVVPPAEPEAVEPEAVSGEEPEAVEPEAAAPEAVESEIVSAAEPEAVASEAVTAEEPELVEPEIVVTPEPSTAESESESIAPESGESEVVQSELVEANVGELETTETAALEAEATEAAAPEPDVHETEAVDAKDSVMETTEAEAVPDEDAAQSEDVESASTTADSAEPTLGNASADSPLDEPAAPEASHADLTPEASEVPDVADPVVSSSDDLPMDPVTKDEEDAVAEGNDPISVNEDASEINENAAAVEEEACSEKIITDTPQSGEYADNSASSPLEAPVSEDPTVVVATDNPDHIEAEGGVEADTPSDTQLPVQESVDDPVYPDDLDADDNHGAAEVIQNAGEVVSSDTSETKEEPMPEATNPDPAEPVDLAPEPDDYYADPPEDEPPASAVVGPAPAESIQDEAVEEEAPSTETPREEPEQQADVVDVPESSEQLAVEAVESPPNEIAIESPGVAASEGPATEDQYDDEDAYNEFEDQDNESAAPEAAPSVEIPAPSAAVMEAPATEDEYEDYENEDYGEEEKPAADPVPPPTSTRSEPPASAREEEIEEVADEPEEAEEEEEAYANDQDDYNNEFEDDDAPKASSPKKDKPVEASADEYEDDAEEDYAEDEEVEESSPRPAATSKSTAAAQPSATHSDDEMEEEELGSDDYADSDG